MWVQAMEPEFSARATDALNHWTISAAPGPSFPYSNLRRNLQKGTLLNHSFLPNVIHKISQAFPLSAWEAETGSRSSLVYEL